MRITFENDPVGGHGKKVCKYSIYQRIESQIETEGYVISGFEPDRFVKKELDVLWEEYKKRNIDDDLENQIILSDLEALLKLPDEEILSAAENNIMFKLLIYMNDYSVLHGIAKNADKFDKNKARRAAYILATKSKYSDIVILGLMLFSITPLECGSPEAEAIKKLALCGKFTGYAVEAAEGAFSEKDFQDTLFEWAQEFGPNCHDDIVWKLKADTDEKKHWMLCYGCRFNLSNRWAGEHCLENSNLRQRLAEGNLSDEEFNGICEIFWRIHTLYNGDMDYIKDPVDITLAILDEIYKRGLWNDNRWLELFCKIRKHFLTVCQEKNEYYTEDMEKIPKHADELIEGSGLIEYLKEAYGKTLTETYVDEIAEYLDMDIDNP